MRFLKVVRFNTIGVMLAGVGSAITGCTAEDAIKALLIWLALALGGGTDTTADTATGAPPIVLYDGGTHNGDLGGRVGANDLCVSAAAPIPAVAEKAHKVAYISVSATDQISDHTQFPDLPTDVPLKSLSGVLIATNWADALDDNGIVIALDKAGVLPGITLWWSGSVQGGGVSANTCHRWLVTAADAHGALGASADTSPQWLSAFSSGDCSNAANHMLCVAY